MQPTTFLLKSEIDHIKQHKYVCTSLSEKDMWYQQKASTSPTGTSFIPYFIASIHVIRETNESHEGSREGEMSSNQNTTMMNCFQLHSSLTKNYKLHNFTL